MTRYLYIAKLRNPSKRAYAFKYLAWLEDNEIGDPPPHDGLSSMAAQAVRMNLRCQ